MVAVISHLLSNTIKFTLKGRVELLVYCLKNSASAEDMIENIRCIAADSHHPQLLQELLRSFLGMAPEHIASAAKAPDSREFKTVRFDARSVQSAATHQGATRLAALCLNPEQVGDEEDPAEILSTIEELRKEFAAYENAMQEVIRNQSTGKVA